MLFRSALIDALILLMVIPSFGCSRKEPPPPVSPPTSPAPMAEIRGEGKKQFEIKCSVCHPLEWATVRNETRESWATIVKEMRAKKDDWITDVDITSIGNFLALDYGKALSYSGSGHTYEYSMPRELTKNSNDTPATKEFVDINGKTHAVITKKTDIDLGDGEKAVIQVVVTPEGKRLTFIQGVLMRVDEVE